jgi:hypothetical protein
MAAARLDVVDAHSYDPPWECGRGIPVTSVRRHVMSDESPTCRSQIEDDAMILITRKKIAGGTDVLSWHDVC